jgi:hypothetical protein
MIRSLAVIKATFRFGFDGRLLAGSYTLTREKIATRYVVAAAIRTLVDSGKTEGANPIYVAIPVEPAFGSRSA